MGQHKRHNQPSNAAPIVNSIEQRETVVRNQMPTTSADEAMYRRVMQHVNRGDYQKALDVLRSAGRDVRLHNAIGVCLLRIGRYDEAVRIFRDLALAPGTVRLKTELPLTAQVNFATALLLTGQRIGCLEVLAQIGQDAEPAVQRLRAVIREWEHKLSPWQRLTWRWGGMEPKNAPLTWGPTGGPPPGDFEMEMAPAKTP